jgi:hypothetical protein
MSEIVINSLASLDSALGQVRDRWFHSKYLRLVIRERKRSLSQNDQIHVWYEQIAVETGEYTALGAKNFSKLHYGVPILRAEDSNFRWSECMDRFSKNWAGRLQISWLICSRKSISENTECAKLSKICERRIQK